MVAAPFDVLATTATHIVGEGLDGETLLVAGPQRGAAVLFHVREESEYAFRVKVPDLHLIHWAKRLCGDEWQ